MLKKKISASLLFITAVSVLGLLSACKQGHKDEEAKATVADTSIKAAAAVSPINLPHADTSLIPVFSKIVDDAFDASAKKDYTKLASLLVYRGTDEKRFGYDVFNARNANELAVVRITAQVFNKWNSGVESKDYPRAFELDQPGEQKLEVLEVIMVSKKKIDRKFFGFLKIKDAYKIADITSNLQPEQEQGYR
jgi:hypothetical protein